MKWCNRVLPAITQGKVNEPINIEAGFGPTGIPHIGTLCEILRTHLVKETLINHGYQVNYLLISDDMDPFRKIPDNIPGGEKLLPYLGKPVCQVPDPFNHYSSFSAMAESRLMNLAGAYGIECQLIRSSEAYRSGFYNHGILKFLQHYHAINELCSLSTGALRQRTYSIFMPVSLNTGKILEHIKISEIDVIGGKMTYYIPSGEVVNKPGLEYAVSLAELYKDEVLDKEVTVSVLNGACKLQWKADWAMRQFVHRINFEMHGEDLRVSASIAKRIAELLGYPPAFFYPYGLFLDENGKKISKSKGNGFSLNDAQKLLSANAIKSFLTADPRRSRPFYRAMAPRLNDMAQITAQNEFSHQKLVRILTAFHPLTRRSAAAFLADNRLFPVVINQHHAERCIEFYFRHETPARYGLNQYEVLLFSRLAQQFPLRSINSEGDDSELFLQALSDNLPQASRRTVFQLVYRGLFGCQNGPKLKTWLRIHHDDEILVRLSNPFTKEIPRSEIFPPAESEVLVKKVTTNIEKKMFLKQDIQFEVVQDRCAVLAYALRKKSDALVKALSGYQCQNVTLDEIDRSVDLLENIHLNQDFFIRKIGGVTSFLPLNQPIYASACFGFVPALMAEDVCIRPPTAMQHHYRRLMEILNLTSFSDSLNICYEPKEVFLSQRVNITDAVIFTGTPENAGKVRKHFRKDVLFILNGAGHNPLIVAEDADLSLALKSAMRVVLYNQGQDCAGPNTILVKVENYPIFISMLISELEANRHQVGDYAQRDVIVGPNSDIGHSIKIAGLFRSQRKYCLYGGEINPINGMIKPTVFSKPLSEGGNYQEFFAPVFFIQPYQEDDELEMYFSHPLYQSNAMYISLFGRSAYIEQRLDQNLHCPESILRNTDLHLEEHGYLPYGGQGSSASCIWIDGKKINGSTLPQREIFKYLIEPVMACR